MSTITTTPTALPVGAWSVDPTHSQVGFAVDYMVGTFRGTFSPVTATLDVSESGTELKGSAPVDAIKVQDENLETHLKSPEFFDAERNPEITFVASELKQDGEQLTVQGELTMRGVTKPITATGTIAGPAQYFDGNDRIAIELETVVDRTEFGINWNAPIPSGGNALANDVTITVELQLVKPSEA